MEAFRKDDELLELPTFGAARACRFKYVCRTQAIDHNVTKLKFRIMR